jgi:4-diphosphocytidyl-2-C-methyl-D-erythritol kinase
MFTLKANAKINLFFNIIGKRADGYHLIESLVVFAKDIYDEIEITESSDNKTFVTGGDFAECLSNDENLIDKALRLFSKDKKFHCKLTKNIPVGAGLGGGSADAAAIARFLDYKQSNLSEKLLKIGADLPVCYFNSPTLCFGIGDVLEPITNFPKLHLVLVNPRKELLTKDVFINNKIINAAPLKEQILNFNYDTDKLINFVIANENSLTDSAIQLMPEIKNILELIAKQSACVISRMSGSGPTCFGVFKLKEEAIMAVNNIQGRYPSYWVQYTEVN